MKIHIWTEIGALALVFVGCKQLSCKPLNKVELREGDLKKAMFLVCKEDINVPLYTFVVLDRNGKIFRHEHIDWRNSNFKLKFSFSHDYEEGGFLYSAKYNEDYAELKIHRDNCFVEGKGLIKIPNNTPYPKTVSELQTVLDDAEKNFAWHRIYYKGLPPPGREARKRGQVKILD